MSESGNINNETSGTKITFIIGVNKLIWNKVFIVIGILTINDINEVTSILIK